MHTQMGSTYNIYGMYNTPHKRIYIIEKLPVEFTEEEEAEVLAILWMSFVVFPT